MQLRTVLILRDMIHVSLPLIIETKVMFRSDIHGSDFGMTKIIPKSLEACPKALNGHDKSDVIIPNYSQTCPKHHWVPNRISYGFQFKLS